MSCGSGSADFRSVDLNGTSSSPDKLNACNFPYNLDDVFTDPVFRLYRCCRIDFISCMYFDSC